MDEQKVIKSSSISVIPIGFKGIIIAGIISAAMSTLSSSINSLSSSFIRDWIPNIKY